MFKICWWTVLLSAPGFWKWRLLSRFSHQNSAGTSFFPICASRPASFWPPWFHHQGNVWRVTQNLKLIIMQASKHNTYKQLLFVRDVSVGVSHNQLISRNWLQSTRSISQQTGTALLSTYFQCCYNFNQYKIRGRFQWPRGLRSAAPRLLGLWVRIPPDVIYVFLSWVLCVVR